MEQHIYNTVFHEVIRQVTVSCAERGQLLAKLRLASMLKAPPGPSRFISKQSLEPERFFWGGFLSCLFCLQTALPVAPGANPPLPEGPAHRGRGTESPQPPAGRGDRPHQDVLPAAQHVRGPAGRKLVMKTLKEIVFFPHARMCLGGFVVLVTERWPDSESTTTACLSKQSRLISSWLELWSRLRPAQSQFGPLLFRLFSLI